MRLFWAIELPAPIRERLTGVQEELGRACPQERIGWVGVERLHVTFKFLGHVDDSGPVIEAARAVLPPAGPLSLEVHGVGAFGGRRPSVIWAGVQGPDLGSFSALAGRVDSALVPLGFEAETRSFKPHVTLGRVRGARRKGSGRQASRLSRVVREFELPPMPFVVDEVVLFQSSLGQKPGPPDYTALARLPLSGP